MSGEKKVKRGNILNRIKTKRITVTMANLEIMGISARKIPVQFEDQNSYFNRSN